MTRLEALKSARGLEHADDTRTLQREIPEIADESLINIHRWYRQFSDDRYAAGWISGPAVEEFRSWLLEEIG